MISLRDFINESTVHPNLASHGITAAHIKKYLAWKKTDAALGNDPYSATKGQRIAHGRARNNYYGDESLTNSQRHKIDRHFIEHGEKGMFAN